ncbi:MAG: hypothetical protein WBB98_12115 [Xanthobacteraceae bacterium]
MDTTQRETKARRHLAKLGYTLSKTPARHWTRAEHGTGFMIKQGIAIVGGYECDIDGPNTCRDYTMTIEQVEEFIADLAAREVREELRGLLRSYTGFGGDRFVEIAAAMVREAA